MNDLIQTLARELDARVAERTKELTAETEARKSMMLNIFHDLRSPLFAVSGGLETLESAPEALPALLPALRQRIEFLRRLTEDLFLAAKLEQKQILLNEDRAALNEEAAAVCAACRSEADQKGVELHVSADTPLPVWGDSVRLQQIIQNLVTNAIHYTPAGGSIHVDCRAEGETACVSVQDTGCGIAPEDQSAVFDRYFHTTADKKHDSTGLGLTIAQELARLHHGEIALQSEVGKGSIFTLSSSASSKSSKIKTGFSFSHSRRMPRRKIIPLPYYMPFARPLQEAPEGHPPGAGQMYHYFFVRSKELCHGAHLRGFLHYGMIFL